MHCSVTASCFSKFAPFVISAPMRMLVIPEVKLLARDTRRHALPENFCRAARVRNFLIRHPCAFRVFVLTELVGGGSDFCRKYYHFGKDLCPEPSVSPEEGFCDL